MVFQRVDNLRAIADRLAHIERVCRLQAKLGLLDDHVAAQHVFCRLLNSAYGLKLENMDAIQKNYPAIDLGDPTNRVSFQITTESQAKKLQHTLGTFVKHSLQERFDALRILIIGERQADYPTLTIPMGLKFDTKRDILGTEELMEHISTLTPPSRLEELKTILDEEVTSVARHKPAGKYRRISDGELRADMTIGGRVALLALTEEFDCEVRTNTRIPSGETWVLFDAAVVRGDDLVGITVYDYKGGGFPYIQVNYLIELGTKVKFDRFRQFTLYVVAVSDADPAVDDKVKADLETIKAKALCEVQIRWFRLNELRAKYNI